MNLIDVISLGETTLSDFRDMVHETVSNVKSVEMGKAMAKAVATHTQEEIISGCVFILMNYLMKQRQEQEAQEVSHKNIETLTIYTLEEK